MSKASRLSPRLHAACLGLALALGGPLAPAHAQDAAAPMDPQAKAHLDRGFEHYQAGEYEQAIAELEKGYSIQPRVEFLFAWAQALRFAGRYELAVDKYEAFIAGGATQSQIEAARALIAECKAKLYEEQKAEREAEEKRKAEQAAASPEPEPPPEPPPRHDAQWRRDPVGGVLVGTGAAAFLGGIGLVVAGQVRAGALGNASTYDEFDREYQQAARSVPAMRIVGGVLLAGGAGLIVGGILRYGKKKREAGRATASLWANPDGAGLVLAGRF